VYRGLTRRPLVSDDLIDQYKKLHQDVAKLEAALEATRTQRGVVAGQLLARDGKGRGYDLGDGVEQIVCATKVGTHYLAPRNKWLKPGRPAPAPKAVKEPKKGKEPKAAKPAKGPKPRRAIINGKLVEVPVERKRASERPHATSEPVVEASPEAPVPEPVPVVETSVALEVPVEAVGAEPPRVEETPEAASPEPDQEVDPLAAALAAIDGM